MLIAMAVLHTACVEKKKRVLTVLGPVQAGTHRIFQRTFDRPKRTNLYVILAAHKHELHETVARVFLEALRTIPPSLRSEIDDNVSGYQPDTIRVAW